MARNLALIDTETNGLQDGYHEIIEVQVQICTPDTELRELERFHAYRHPTHPERNDPFALKVNKYDEKTWPAERGEHVDPRIAQELSRILKGTTLVGVNVEFDARMIAAFLGIAVSGKTPWHFKQTDVTSWALPLMLQGKIKSLSTVDVYPYFGIPLGDHTTTGDLKSMKELVRVMLR